MVRSSVRNEHVSTSIDCDSLMGGLAAQPLYARSKVRRVGGARDRVLQ
jgi:hypothetical protein